MRLWHKDLIPALPKQQLLSQWRECCLIAKNISEKGTPNHILVNKIMDYPIDHFLYYAGSICTEMLTRGYKCTWKSFEQYGLCPKDGRIKCNSDMLFENWHNDRYLKQCFCNLQEKYDCGGMTKEEYATLYRRYYETYYHEKI